MIREIVVDGNIRLDQILKWSRVTSTGGQSKLMIQSGKVKVNGKIETRRSYKISDGDLIEVEGIGKFKAVFEK
ncbi:RNA-binding S4 domain-containing protein [Peptococcaceae bacterium]|nr:RNA-binding S4 domain-containing protein [Peptococcaceae bacterium]MCL0032200.1 RNA-binding S4 domain-containing protein [Peptococcaceae bacterium]MCL0041556.1 RNA-binding S4 domain-containing protein [Peptococcaceae bacterium]MCL0067734.1 RNA-binding S4 domain-containing protein [Peptococcaceae bacterium]MCL0101400.1 RNA-binding S4 domain-containing protein [Peptococcaceae bacterium]